MTFNDHEFAPGFPVTRLLTSPSEVGFGIGGVCDASIRVCGVDRCQLFEDIDDRSAVVHNPTQLGRREVRPRSSQPVQPFNVPGLFVWIGSNRVQPGFRTYPAFGIRPQSRDRRE